MGGRAMPPRFRQPWGVRVCTIAGEPRVIICVQPGIYLNGLVEFQGAACKKALIVGPL